jgi:hypothetical protein
MENEMRKYIDKFKNSKFILNENDIINNMTSQLDKMGVKYEMSKNPYLTFKAIYKPINKSDEFYKHFEDFISLNNLGNVVK